MSVLSVLAGKLSAETTERAVIEYMADKDELFALLPFTKSPTNIYSWYRTGDVPTASVVDPYGTIPEVDVSGTVMQNKISMIAADVVVYNFEATAVEQLVDRVLEKTLAASEAIARAFKRLFITGNQANPNEFDGLDRFVDADMVVNAGSGGAPISFQLLDQLLEKFPAGAEPTAIIVHPRTYLSIKALLRTLYVNPEQVMIPNFGRPVMAYNGTPILRNEYIPITSGLTSVYAVRLGQTAVHGVYMGDNAGVVIEEVGKVQDKDARKWRLKWYVSMASKNKWDVAKIVNVNN
jgi:outer membrane murein-binding lipoprotein Lpp